MRRSLKIGSVAGIGVFLHWTFGLLLAGLPALYLWQGASAQAAATDTGVVLVLFGCVALHELGHALAARRFAVPTIDITLYPIGGIARLERIPEEPMKEFWIAVAGPAVNFAIALLAGGAAVALGAPLGPQAALLAPGSPAGIAAAAAVPATLLWANLALGFFNLLPAFPMDGGRVLRALLATRLPFARATRIASTVGQAMALGFGFLSLYSGNAVLLFIAAFVYLGARQEARQTATRQTATREATLGEQAAGKEHAGRRAGARGNGQPRGSEPPAGDSEPPAGPALPEEERPRQA